ncbi:multicomponent Na+:H+ antiporter subunit D [Natronincola peptidivorans]|uniref:Multicomponent Na+:H+ antiporter subunit D n=1 Tax=Natronincola peptidivorans TaxID=426128 RepID=A0A1I0BJ76_9FIRM|nr:proton-conducting transporter membrane subunit [Natronincola peptidivorans]SET06611.1 multicomponent Na+:H+ antiporter subunit D [Natronincola peptidivorans]
MGNNQGATQHHQDKSAIDNQEINKELDIFYMNSIFILFAVAFIAGAYALMTTEAGTILLNAVTSFRYTPTVMVILVFVAAPLSVLIGSKSENYRDMFIINIIFAVFLLILSMFPQALKTPIIMDLPSVLAFGVNLRVDQLTLLMVLAAALLWLMAMIYGHNYMILEENNRNRFYFWFLVTYGGVTGALMANDLLTMFLFFEIMYLSCYFLVAHNQTGDALKAGNRYIYMGVVGGLSMLLGISLLYVYTNTFIMGDILAPLQAQWGDNSAILTFAIVVILVGFAIKAAVFPLHFWLPDAHSSAPSPASAILSGMVLKVYVFSLMKFLFKVVGIDIIKDIGLHNILPPLAVVGMIMGSIFAIGQKDIKKILAYSSVAQVGYMILGIGLISDKGFAASMFHITTHALMKSALFLSAGAIILQTHKRDIREFQGIGYQMPITMGVFTVGALSMIGIPGFNGFMSKWYLCIAALDAGKPIFVFMILVSSFLNAMYYLPIIISAFLKKSQERENILVMDKAPANMLIPMVIIASGVILLGFFPQWVMKFVEQGITTFL